MRPFYCISFFFLCPLIVQVCPWPDDTPLTCTPTFQLQIYCGMSPSTSRIFSFLTWTVPEPFSGFPSKIDSLMFEPELQEWANASTAHAKLTASLTPDVMFAIDRYYFSHYCKIFRSGAFGLANASIPMVRSEPPPPLSTRSLAVRLNSTLP